MAIRKFGPREVAIGAASILAVLELIHVFQIDVPVAPLVFAVLFVLGAYLLRRGARAGAVLVAVLALIELAGVLSFYGPPEGPADVVYFVFFGVFSAVALVACVWTLVRPSPRG